MGCTRTASALLAVALGLTACNTTEGLVPPEAVGNDTGSVSGSNGVAFNRQTEEAPPAPAAGYPPSPSGYDGGTQSGSLDAQARSLESGNGPMQPPPAQYGDNRRLADTSGQQVRQGLGTPPRSLDQQAALQQPMPALPPASQENSPAEERQAALPAAGNNTIRFLPIIGAPVEAVTPLSRQLGAEARASGLTIRSSGDTAAAHILKGYFSAFNDSGKVTVVYVWDVLDANGRRLHRIQGQEAFASSASDAWSAVPGTLMQQIGTKTIEAYLTWRGGGAG